MRKGPFIGYAFSRSYEWIFTTVEPSDSAQHAADEVLDGLRARREEFGAIVIVSVHAAPAAMAHLIGAALCRGIRADQAEHLSDVERVRWQE